MLYTLLRVLAAYFDYIYTSVTKRDCKYFFLVEKSVRKRLAFFTYSHRCPSVGNSHVVVELPVARAS